MNRSGLIVIFILIIAGMWYFSHRDTANVWIAEHTGIELGSIDLTDPDFIKNTITKKWDENFVREQLDNFVIKDGVSLPEGWTLTQKMLDDSYVTAIVPPHADDENDYITPRIRTTLIDKLPEPHLCAPVAEGARTTTCVVGSHIETHRVFHLMVYL